MSKMQTPTSTFFFFVFLGCLSSFSLSGKVNPSKGKPILLSSNNKGYTSNYTFSFTLDTDTYDTYQLIITFPENEYSSLITPYSSCSAEQIRNVGTEYETGTESVDCWINSDSQYEVEIGTMRAGDNYTHEVKLIDLTNPSDTIGTGHFALETKKGDLNIFDYNYLFGQVGIADNPSSLSGSASIVSGKRVNKIAKYLLSVSISVSIPTGGFLRVTLPDELRFLPDSFGCSTTIYDGASCVWQTEHIVDLKGLRSFSSSSFDITLEGVKNPGYELTPSNFKVEVWDNYTATILADTTSISAPLVSRQVFSDDGYSISAAPFGDPSGYIVDGDYLEYDVWFIPGNDIPEWGSFTIEMPSGFSVSSCRSAWNLLDIDEDNLVTCTADGSETITMTNFQKVQEKEIIGVVLRVTNGAAGTGDMVITTYSDSSQSKVIEESDPYSITVSSTVVAFSALSFTQTNSEAQATSGFTIDFTPSADLNTLTEITIVFSSNFTLTGTISCSLEVDGTADGTATCSGYESPDGRIFVEGVTGGSSWVTSSTLEVIIADGAITNPSYANDFWVQMTVDDSTAGSIWHQTSWLTITSIEISTSSLSMTPITLDYSKATVYILEFVPPEELPSGKWSNNPNDVTSFFNVEFENSASLFQSDLGTGYTDGETFPCYGYQSFDGSSIECKIYHGTSSDSAYIQVFSYPETELGATIEVHFPNICNPTNIGETPQFDIRIYISQYRESTIAFETFTSYVAPLATVDWNLYKNENNDNDGSGGSTNESPIFYSQTILTESYLEIKLTTSRTVTATGGMMIFFPDLPTTTPQYYLVPDSSTCYVSNVLSPCYAYKEVGWIILKDLPVDLPLSDEVTIVINGFTNPGYIYELNNYIQIYTFRSDAEVEDFIFMDLDSFESGTLTYADVFPDAYFALGVDTTYQFIFKFEHDVPEGGYIILYFPPNYFDLESSTPCPVIEFIEGIEWLDEDNNPNESRSSCSEMYASSVATIYDFKEVKAGELIVLKVYGVKNPSQTGYTPYFEIESQTPEGYTIDIKSNIPAIYILRELSAGQVVFEYFHTTPNNGKLLGNYYLSFYPETTIPAGGSIEVVFPTTEFSISDFIESDSSGNVRCEVSGSLETVESCTVSLTTVTVELDEDLIIEDGMEPVKIHFPHVMNYNAELSSGVVKVSTYYDSVLLDESGDSETNRKALTSYESSQITVSGFSYAPTTQGERANYTVVLKPTYSFNEEATIMFEFPYEYPRGLGDNVLCFADSIQISSEDPLNCTVENWILNITNHAGRGYSDADPLEITIVGIVNPNLSPGISTSPYGIKVFILSEPYYAKEYSYSIGSLAFGESPEPLKVAYYSWFKDEIIRNYHDQHIRVSTLVNSFSYDMVILTLDDQYEPELLDLSAKLQIEGGNYHLTPQNDQLLMYFSDSLPSLGASSELIVLKNISSPYQSGEVDYLTVAFYRTSSKVVLGKTYFNLFRESTPEYNQNLEVIKINDEDIIYTVAGTYTEYIKIELPSASISQLILKGFGYTSLLELDDIVIPAGSTEAEFWVGCETFDITRTTHIYWELSGSSSGQYHAIYPLEIMILPYKNVSVSVESFDSIPAGGRTEPLTISLERAPMYEMIFKIYRLTADPELFGVFPHTITFEKGDSEHVFWLSVDEEAYGDAGSIVFVMRGELTDTYVFPTRRYDFIITKPSPVMNPIIIDYSVSEVTDNTITVYLKASEPSTTYFVLAPRGTHDVSWDEVRQKHLLYDYYAEKIILGEYIEDSATNEYTFTIGGVKMDMDYFLKIWVQGEEGALCEDPVRYNFTTFRETPQLVHLLFTEQLDESEVDQLFDKISTVLGVDSSRVLSFESFHDEYPIYEDFWLGEEILDSIEFADDLTGSLPFEVIPKDVISSRKSALPKNREDIDDYIEGDDESLSDSNGSVYSMDFEDYDYDGMQDLIDEWNAEEDKYFPIYNQKDFFDPAQRVLKFDDDDEFYYKASFTDISVYLEDRLKEAERRDKEVEDLFNVSFFLLPDYSMLYNSTGILEQLLKTLESGFGSIKSLIPSFQSSYGYISGSYEKMRAFWGLKHKPRVKEIRENYVTMDGFDLNNDQCQLVASAYLPERADYSASMEVPSSVIRYLAGSGFSDSTEEESSSSSDQTSNVIEEDEEEFIWCEGEIIEEVYFDIETLQEATYVYCEGEELYPDNNLPDCEELYEPSYLTYACDGEGMTSNYHSEQYLRIIHYTMHSEMPTPYQIARGFDSTNYKALSTNFTDADSMNNTVTISGLIAYKAHMILVTAECFDEDTNQYFYLDKNQTVEFFVIAYDGNSSNDSQKLCIGLLALAFWSLMARML